MSGHTELYTQIPVKKVLMNGDLVERKTDICYILVEEDDLSPWEAVL